MLKSMTGYSRVQDSFDWGTVTLEVSSVNHKYQDVSIRLPKELSGVEPSMQKRLRSAFRRGKVVLKGDVCWSKTYKTCSINADILEGYVRNIQKTLDRLGLEREPQIELLLNLPGVLEQAASGDVFPLEAMGKDMEGLLESALEEWLVMRQTEGRHLLNEIMAHLDDFCKLLAAVKQRWPEARDEAIGSFRERIRILLSGQANVPEESRIAQEVVMMNDKWDITEELARLDSHVAKFREIMDNVEVSGKKLDFLVQEMNREVNTIASKSNDSTLRWQAVEAKSILERIREQIQNVE